MLWPWCLFMSSTNVENSLRCYRLDYRASYDEEMVWSLVQRHGGRIEVRRDCIDFWIDSAWEPLLTLAFPDLVRHPELDHI